MDIDDFDLPQELIEEYNTALSVLKEIEKKIVEFRLSNLITMPKCPECGIGVDRFRCLYEFGADCSRHEVIDSFGGLHKIRERLRTIKNV